MNDGREHNGGGQVCWGKDANRGLVHARHEGALNDQGARDGDCVSYVGGSVCIEDVFNDAQFRARTRWQVAWEEVGEREGVCAVFEPLRFGEKDPGEEDCRFGAAVGAVFGDGLFRRQIGIERHGECLKGDRGVSDCEEELAGEESAGGLGGRAVEDERRRFHIDHQLGRLLGTDLRTTLARVLRWRGRSTGEAQALPLLLGREDIHGGLRWPAFCGFSPFVLW